MMRTLLKFLGVSLASGLAYFIGTMLGGVLAGALGMAAPAMPEGTEPNTLMIYLLLASLGMGVLLAGLSAALPGSRLARWGLLALLIWVVYSLSTYLEASIYTTYDSASLYKVVMDAVASLAAAGVAAVFYRGRAAPASPALLGSDRAWRLAAAWLAFPVIYLGFGKVVEPWVIAVYQQGLFEMTAPTWAQILPAQALRSLLFVIVCAPVAARLPYPRVGAWACLATALFLLTGGFYMLQAYWLPGGFRAIHSLEMLADAAVYTGVLVALFSPAARPAHRPALSGI